MIWTSFPWFLKRFHFAQMLFVQSEKGVEGLLSVYFILLL